MAKGTYEELADDPYLKEIVSIHSEQVASYKVENQQEDLIVDESNQQQVQNQEKEPEEVIKEREEEHKEASDDPKENAKDKPEGIFGFTMKQIKERLQ